MKQKRKGRKSRTTEAEVSEPTVSGVTSSLFVQILYTCKARDGSVIIDQPWEISPVQEMRTLQK